MPKSIGLWYDCQGLKIWEQEMQDEQRFETKPIFWEFDTFKHVNIAQIENKL